MRAAGVEVVTFPDGVGRGALVAECADADLLLMCYTPVTARVIAAAQKLKGIVKYGVGIDAIDIAAARARRIPVVNVPEYAEETVAEGAFALMIALAKKLLPISARWRRRAGRGQRRDGAGIDLAGRTLGLVGPGKIGRSMARMAGRASACACSATIRMLGGDHARSRHRETRRSARDAGEERIVSVHAVLNDETRHLIGARELAAMKPSAFLINVSRGAIVDEAALVAALQEKRIAGAALDVYSAEPLARPGIR